MEIHLLPAEYGDAIVIKTTAEGKPFTIVVDGGPESSADKIAPLIKSLGHINLMVLTHFDEDHIMGLIRYVEGYKGQRMPVEVFWCNCAQEIDLAADTAISATGFENANTLAHYLRKQQQMDERFLWSECISNIMPPFEKGDLRIDVLSPSDEVLKQLQHDYNEYIKTNPTWTEGMDGGDVDGGDGYLFHGITKSVIINS